MRIRVKTSGQVGVTLAGSEAPEGATLDVAEGATPASVLERIGLAAEGSYLIVVNGTSVPRSERHGRVLAEGDELAVLPPLRGG